MGASYGHFFTQAEDLTYENHHGEYLMEFPSYPTEPDFSILALFFRKSDLRYWFHYTNRTVGLSGTGVHCHSDICSCNICPELHLAHSTYISSVALPALLVLSSGHKIVSLPNKKRT